ncbi:trypsin-like peptidase domain-containing protein [Lewinella sp. 4G2]|uniref:trypsin-like peptidase domain-containing protein n=1 Tax=Lewinella sp. 4G2 TaxID=1803372 RepID=UPI0007B49AB3|nr:trypsin-like peptidase domain-containing protein [Lewinella sp. 4G2]OAV42924.1 hypothetical protein A3850_017020 [Lewinella sp. 4G2]
MKKLLFVVLAAIVGGLAALGGAQYFGWNQSVKYVELESKPATNFARYADPSGNSGTVAPAPAAGFSVAAEKTLPAVVHIKASKKASGSRGEMQIDPNQLPPGFRDLFGGPRGGGQMPDRLQQGSGSGVIISADGYIATNNHVVEDAEELEVVLNDQRTYDAEIIGVDPTTDIALIKIDADQLPTVDFANSDALKIGDWVVAVGNPFSLTSTVTAGIVSAKGRSIDIVRQSGGDLAIESFIQTDAVVNPGNSGGALVDINGNLVGINTAISSPTGVFAGYSFAVPSAIVKKVTEDLREFGIVQRGLLGAKIRELNTGFAKELGIDRDNGVYVSDVISGSAAEEAGLQEGDVIVGVDGVTTLRNSELLEQLGRRRPGDVVTLSYERDGDARTAQAKLQNTEGGSGSVSRPVAARETQKLGAEFVELSEGQAEDLGIDGGVVIRKINEGLVAEQTRIRPGFVVQKIDGRTVRSIKDVDRALSGASGPISLEGVHQDTPNRKEQFAVIK